MERIQSKWQLIREEGLKQMKEGVVNEFVRPQELDEGLAPPTEGWVKGWTGDPKWLNYGLIYGDKFLERNCELCPETYELLKEVQRSDKIFMAGFSWLRPKSSIPPHTDEDVEPFRVFHLGLSVPKGKCLLIVDGKVEFQEDGKLIEFDDRKMHSALNAATEDRLTLYVKCYA